MRIGQQPADEQLFLDHIGHWLPNRLAAADALQALGFTLTPFSEQTQPGPDGAPAPAGSGNHCVMLEQGYLEFLVPLADTPIGRELRDGIKRYVGVHIAAFATADAAGKHRDLEAAGYPQRPLTALSRPVLDIDDEAAIARFTVARPQPGVIAEGRVQFLTHHTPELIWQPRYVVHANTARSLEGIVLVVSDLTEASARYRRLFARDGHPVSGGHLFELEHGAVALLEPDRAGTVLRHTPIPAPPAMANYVVQCSDVAAFTRHARAVCTSVVPFGRRGAVLATFPDALGAACIATPSGLRMRDLLA